MSFLDTLKTALSSKVAQQIEGALPTIAVDVAEVVADPTKLISILAELVSGEMQKLTDAHTALSDAHSALSQTVSTVAGQVGNAVTVAQSALDVANSVTQAVASAPTTQSAVVDATELAANVFAALQPKLAPYTDAISILAQHFPQLTAVPAQAVATPAAQ